MQIKQFVPEQHKVKALVYGKPGTGKTSFAATAPKPLFLSAEWGLLSIAKLKPDYVEIKSFHDLKEALVYLRTQKHDYETVIIDSITEVNEIIKAEITARTGRAIQKNDWVEVQEKIKQIIRGFRDLNMHCLFLALETIEKDEERMISINPALNGKAATDIAGFMDIVGYISLDKATGIRKMIVKENATLATKDRANVLPPDPGLDFSKWCEFVAKIKIGKEWVIADFTAPEQLDMDVLVPEVDDGGPKKWKEHVLTRAGIQQIATIKTLLNEMRGTMTDLELASKLRATIKTVTGNTIDKKVTDIGEILNCASFDGAAKIIRYLEDKKKPSKK